MVSSRSLPLHRLVVFVLAITLALSSVVAVSAQQDQDEDQQEQQDQQRQRGDELQQLEDEQQFLEEERQRLEDEIEQLEEEGASERQIRQREQELQQVVRAQRQVERQILRLELQDEQGQNQQNQDQLQQLEEEQQQLEEERQQVQEELQQAEEDNAPQREIRQLEDELEQIEEEQRQVEQEIQRLGRQGQNQQQRGQAEQVTLREVIRNTEDYVGQRVQVSGELTETPVPNVYTFSRGNQQIAVIADPQAVPTNAQGTATVVGTVQQVSIDALAQALNVQVPRSVRNMLRDFGPITLLFAERVTTGRATTGQDGQQGETEDQEDRRAQGEEVTVRNLTRNPEDFANQDVLVSGEVGEDLGRTAFTISQRGQEILVVGDPLTVPNELGGVVEVLGQVRESFDIRDIEDELGVQLNDRQLRDFEGEPFVVAETVSSSELDRPVPGAGG